jgi:hypothetical protein
VAEPRRKQNRPSSVLRFRLPCPKSATGTPALLSVFQHHGSILLSFQRDVPVEDNEGDDFPNREEAIAAAQRSARELASHREPAQLHGQVLRVTDEVGEEIASLKLEDYRNALTS